MFDKETLKPGIVLGLTALVLAFLLAAVNLLTRDTISTRADKDTQNALSSLIPDSTFTKLESGGEEIIYKAEKDGNFAGYCVISTSTGYSSTPIKIIVAIDADYGVTGVSIIESDETPGLGSKVKEDNFLNQFIGKTEPFKVKKDGGEIEAISGATKSSRAVAGGINKAISAVKLLGGAENE